MVFDEKVDKDSRTLSIVKRIAGKVNAIIKEKHWIRLS